ncbi:MAG: hypothetical protein ACR2QM_12820, partial [Longimicrobiales bacterium]
MRGVEVVGVGPILEDLKARAGGPLGDLDPGAAGVVAEHAGRAATAIVASGAAGPAVAALGRFVAGLSALPADGRRGGEGRGDGADGGRTG